MAEYTDHIYCETYPYVTPEEVLGCCQAASESMTAEDPRLLDAIDDASMIVYYLTGKQFGGTCQTTIRPCVCDQCICDTCKPNQINLRVWPVISIDSVRLDGVTITGADVGSTFHIDEYRYLVRNDGGKFPYPNHSMSTLAGSARDNAEDGYVFEVTVTYGLQTPRLLTRAARELACELLKGCLDIPCQLPQRVTNLTRQGISMDVASVQDFLEAGRTGIYAVDLAIQTFNPSHIQSPAFFWTPDLSYPRRVNT